MKPNFDEIEIDALLADGGGLRISIFSPMERAGPEMQQNPIRFKNLLRLVQEKLERAGADKACIRRVRARLSPLLDEHEFWQHQGAGLAVFADSENATSYRLPIAVQKGAYVAERFQILPLVPLLNQRNFIVLAVSQNCVRWFQGNCHVAWEKELPDDVPRCLTDVVGHEVSERHLQYHGAQRRPGSPIYHGQGGGKDDVDPELEHFCRRIAEALQAPLRKLKADLFLAGDVSLTSVFKRVADFDAAEETLDGNFDVAHPEAILERVAPIIRQRETEALRAMIDRFGTLNAQDRATLVPDSIAAAAEQGRIESLLVADDRGDGPSAAVPPNESFCNKVAIDTLRNGGAVHNVPWDMMPGQRRLAALLRY